MKAREKEVPPFPLRYGWELVTLCSDCGFKAMTCGRCNNGQLYSTMRDVERHHLYHRSAQRSKETLSSLTANPHPATATKESNLRFISKLEYLSKSSKDFLEVTVQKSTLDAIFRLTAVCAFRTKTIAPMVLNEVKPTDAALVLALGRLVLRIGSTSQGLLSTVLQLLNLNLGKKLAIPVPASVEEFRSVFLNPSTTTSLQSQLPTPCVEESMLRHASVPFCAFIQHAMAFPNTEPLDYKYQALLDSDLGTAKFDAAVHACRSGATALYPTKWCRLALTFLWFDDWDKASTMCKSNKGGIFTGNCTVIFVTLKKQLLNVATNVITIGPSKKDHEFVYSDITDGVLSLQSNFMEKRFFDSRNCTQPIVVYPMIYYILGDQPARRSMTGLMAGNSNMHPLFGYSLSVKNLDKSFEACPTCLLKLKSGKDSMGCKDCYCWSLPSRNRNMKYKEPLYKEMETELPVLRKANVGPIVLKSRDLMDVWDECFDDLVNKQKSAKTVREKLDLMCFNKANADRLIDGCKRIIYWKQFESNPTSLTEEDAALLQKQKHDNPKMFEKPGSPNILRLCEVEQDFIETPMHMTMNTIKTTSKLAQKFCNKRGKGSDLANHMKGWITLMTKICRVDSNRLADYSEENKFPGWVADTFRTWNKLMPWFYSCLSDAEYHYEPFVPPDDDWKKWKKNDVQKFLRSRQIKFDTKARIGQLKELIRQNLLPDGSLPAYNPIPIHTIDAGEVQEMIWNCHNLFKIGFGTKKLSNDILNCHVKLFLSSITKIGKVLAESDSDKRAPIYLTKYGLIGLLRAFQNQKNDWTSFRYTQEGGLEGEGIVKVLRPLVPNNLRDHFARNLIKAKYRDDILASFSKQLNGYSTTLKTLNLLLKEESSNNDMDSDAADDVVISAIASKISRAMLIEKKGKSIDIDQPEDYKRYKSSNVIQEYIKIGVPISVVFVLDPQSGDLVMGSIFKEKGAYHLLHLLPGSLVRQQKWEFPYFTIDVGTLRMTVSGDKDFKSVPIQSTGFLLPDPKDNNNENKQRGYALLTTEMEHLDQWGKWS